MFVVLGAARPAARWKIEGSGRRPGLIRAFYPILQFFAQLSGVAAGSMPTGTAYVPLCPTNCLSASRWPRRVLAGRVVIPFQEGATQQMAGQRLARRGSSRHPLTLAGPFAENTKLCY